jgi:hypothetical protein
LSGVESVPLDAPQEDEKTLEVIVP